ncbi:MAG TPA: hypothetical protein DDW65_12200 [Firmicutes bacterium]|jgi:signal transduction histidine kinase|nr:hypothetical protein [Bacillota bacterium]
MYIRIIKISIIDFVRRNELKRARVKHNSGAIGWGISLVKKIVEMHEGKIIVKSEKDQSAEFIVTPPNHNTRKNDIYLE